MPGRRPRLSPGPLRPARRLVALLVVVAGALGAPATAASGLVTAREAGSERPARCPRGTRGDVVTAYADVFGRAIQLGGDERAASLEDGDDPALRALLDRWLADPTSASTTLTAEGVTCTGPGRARVTTVLVLAGNPLPEVLPAGRAVREDGTWKVARSTFCRRLVLEIPALGEAGACARRTSGQGADGRAR